MNEIRGYVEVWVHLPSVEFDGSCFEPTQLQLFRPLLFDDGLMRETETHSFVSDRFILLQPLLLKS